MIRIKAPEGYKLYDPLTDKNYSEIDCNEKDRDRFVLVPASQEQIVTEERR